jgi:clan AA aspartic protease
MKGESKMGLVYEEITLKNVYDVETCDHGLIKESEVRQITVQALVDTGASTLVITEEIQKKLGLGIKGKRYATLANSKEEVCKITGAVEISWKDRSTIVSPLVIPGNGDVLLGAIPLEAMDLIVDPSKQALIGAHGKEIRTYIMCA